jgi:phosphoribosylformylglycinamidine synthase PurS subunit
LSEAYKIDVRVTPRGGILDPAGKAIHHALQSLGYEGTEQVRVGKLIELDLTAESEDAALETAAAMCRRLLANPVTEDFELRIRDRSAEIHASRGYSAGGPK